MVDTFNEHLSLFGFRLGRASPHSSRTMMLDELSTLLSHVSQPDATKADYLAAIKDENCLGKRSQKTRNITAKHLVELYSLDPADTVFRALLYFWQRDVQARPLLALLCAYVRDPILRMSSPLILKAEQGAVVERQALEDYIEEREPGRFSRATLKSTAQNVNSSWTQSGHLTGRSSKVRSRAASTPGTVAYALFLGYLSNARGQSLFTTDFAKLLDCPVDRALEMANIASRRGWLVFKRIGDVVEVLFPALLTSQEMEWLREQN